MGARASSHQAVSTECVYIYIHHIYTYGEQTNLIYIYIYIYIFIYLFIYLFIYAFYNI